jgi:hypothetical protein
MDAQRFLCNGLERAGLEPSASYTTGQVAKVLGVSPETVRRLVDAYEPPGIAPDPPVDGAARRRYPSGMRALRIFTHRRIPHQALLDWIRDNAAYLRANRADL